MSTATKSAKHATDEISGSEALIRALIDEGVEVIFGYPGGAIMPAYDALFDYQDKIRHVLVRHEQGGAHAAEGYARMSGKPGVCFATSGPGATNLVTGIADAMLDSVPVVFITGQVVSSLLGSDAFQETDVIGITIPITKWNYQITDAREIPGVIAKAFYIASMGRPGPVVIDITKDAQMGKVRYHYQKVTSLESCKEHRLPDPAALAEAAELINEARKPFMFIGQGVRVAKAEAEVAELIEKAGIPVAATLHGLSALPSAHPLYVGMLGMHGNYGPNMLSNKADVVIAVGMRFDDRVTMNLSGYLANAKVIHIEVDPAEVDKNVKTDVAIVADAKEALRALIPLVEKNSHEEWLGEFQRLNQIEYDKIIKKGMEPEDDKLRMIEVITKLSQKTKGEAAIIADVGQHQMATARNYRFARANSFITSGGLGTMGFSVPAAMGAKLAAPDREVIVVVGDGSFQMKIQELATIAQEKLRIKVIVLANGYLGMVRQWQELFHEKRYSFTELKNPDFVRIAEGFGVRAARVHSREELDAALDEMLAAENGYVLEVAVEKEENVFPMVPAGAVVTDIRLE